MICYSIEDVNVFYGEAIMICYFIEDVGVFYGISWSLILQNMFLEIHLYIRALWYYVDK